MVEQVQNMKIALSDKMAILQVLGGLIKNPLLFADRRYSLKTTDFPERFHQIVFGAIEYLARQGLTSISVMDIDQFLVKHDIQYKVFTDNQGANYVQKAVNMAGVEKFDYYYNVVKKCALLGELYESGFAIQEILDVTLVDAKKKAEQRERFDQMSLQDILLYYQTKMIGIEQKFSSDKRIIKKEAGSGIETFISSFGKESSGAPFVSPKLTTMVHGQKLNGLYLDASPSGGGKSRRQIAEAAHLAIPQYYNTYNKKWANTGLKLGVLYISTELTTEEVQGIILSYVTGINQLDMEDGKITPEELARVNQAAKYLKEANFHIVTSSSLGIDDLLKLIRQYKQIYNVRYVFYDYLSPSAEMKASFAKLTGTKTVRDDEVLLETCTRFKELANELHIHIRTSSQMNRTWKNDADLDADNLRGGFSLPDKTDLTLIAVKPREGDMAAIATYLEKGFTTRPNLVTSIKKIRKGKYKDVKLYSYFDFATSRTEDCFVTDADGNFINVENAITTIIDEDGDKDKEQTTSKYGEFVL